MPIQPLNEAGIWVNCASSGQGESAEKGANDINECETSSTPMRGDRHIATPEY